MLSPEATQNAPAPHVSGEDERELKFALPIGRVHLARRWLERVCRRDPEFPAAIVWTIYYDTPALVSLAGKINSDYLKRKIRIRWYSDLHGRVSGPAFVEAKLRVGTRRSKVRERLSWAAGEIAQWSLQDSRLLTIPSLLRQHGILGHESWQPLMLLRYRRDRFLDLPTRSRVSLDADIAGVAVHPRLVPGDRSPLASAVLEVKGSGDRLPRTLKPLLHLGIHKRSFSKFLTVYAHMMREVL
ncbi:MAG TPA: VTC domain-containing protein [Vicinamibacterales bacterium]|nr:VTC domain-containing protein [Vicinamibacterales bacterium]